jgi:hypothetical protein
MDEDYYSGDPLQDLLEGQLLELGGKWLLDDARGCPELRGTSVAAR